MTIAFDVDGTLLNMLDKPRPEIITMLKTLSKYNTIIVWSGGGKGYADLWVERLGLEAYVNMTMSKLDARTLDRKPDVCFDDMDVQLAQVNIQV